MKVIGTILFALLFPLFLSAQKIDYKSNVISIDGKDVAKVNKIKMNFGLTNNFELFSLSGKKLLTATMSTDFVPPHNDNTYFYYRFVFLTTNQEAIFSLSKLGAEKSFVNLIGTANIVANDDLDPQAVNALIAVKNLNPQMAPAPYVIVDRDINYPFTIKADKTIEQQKKLIGSFKEVTVPGSGVDSYEFMLPNGEPAAKISFTDGNNAQSFDAYMAKDHARQIVRIPTREKIIASAAEDRNYFALQRFVKWMIEHKYM